MKILRTTGKYKLDVQVDDDWAEKLQFARLYGVPSKKGGDFYVSVVIPGGRPEFLSRLIMQPPPGMEVDHLDYDPLNNTRANLVISTPAQNNQRRRYAPGRSGFIGVAVADKGADVFYLLPGAHQGQREARGLRPVGHPGGAARIYDAGTRHFYGPNARANFPAEPVLSLEDARLWYARNARRGRPAKTSP
jgi:HNH endonuclease